MPYKNGKYCSRICMGIAAQGKERPSMKGLVPWNKGETNATSPKIAAISAKKLKNVIDCDTLEQLYVSENLSLKAIGERYDVSKHVIKRLVDEYGLERTHRKLEDLTPELVAELYKQGFRFTDIARQYECSASVVQKIAYKLGVRGKTIMNRAGVEPTKELLQQLYWDEWLGYEAIGKRLEVDFTTIPYWLKKFSIPRRTLWETRRGRNWVEPDQQVVAHLYEAENMGTDAIGKLFKVSNTHIRKLLNEMQIPLRKSGYPNVSHYTAKDGHRVKSSLELLVDDWLFTHNIPHQYEGQIGDTNLRTDFIVGDTYIEIWGIIGHQAYEDKRERKLKAYQRHQLKLLSVYPHDFPDLHVLEPLTEYAL